MKTKNRIKNYIIIIFAGIFLGLAVFWYFRFKNYQTAEIDGHKFFIELALTPAKQKLGLGGTKKLCQNCAMLFDFPRKDKHIFWMKDMNFDLDIIWIDQNKIVYIEKNISHKIPQNTYSGVPSKKVMEINAGLSDKYGFKVGDEVVIK